MNPSTSYEAERLAAHMAAAVFDIHPADADHLLGDPTGAALLTLMAGSAANRAERDHLKQALYEHKRILLCRAIRMARDWWAAPHVYGETGYADTVIYIETTFARFSFHCQKADPYLADLLAEAPTSDRGWSGQALQPYAGRLAYAYMAGRPKAAEVIADIVSSVNVV